MLAGHDMIAKAPTGTGKTVAFGIPILQKAAGFPAGAPKQEDIVLINANKRHTMTGKEGILAARFEIDFHLL